MRAPARSCSFHERLRKRSRHDAIGQHHVVIFVIEQVAVPHVPLESTRVTHTVVPVSLMRLIAARHRTARHRTARHDSLR